MKAISIRIIILLTLYLAISACGNKGELYMPDKQDDKEQSNDKS